MSALTRPMYAAGAGIPGGLEKCSGRGGARRGGSPEGRQQIWVAAVDTAKAANGDDPSYPAFRVPFQGLNEDNHRAFWALDVADGTGGGGGQGAGGGTTTGGGCTTILTVNDPCDPLLDCCETGAYCSSPDNGATYVCTPPVPG